MMRIFLVLTSCLLASSEAVADGPKMDPATRKAIANGLAYLAKQQNADGSWSEASYPHHTGISSFALLAFLSDGNLPRQGTYAPEVARGSRFLLASGRPEDGYLVGARGGNMYAHALATMVLGEIWGSTADEKIEPVLKKAVDLIVRTQAPSGGWRYAPEPTDADISATIMQVMALRAAQNSGLHVPKETMKKALSYVLARYSADDGGFSYQKIGKSAFGRTAAGICVLQLTGEYHLNRVPKAVDYLKQNANTDQHWWYAHYYAAHAMHQVGGKDWDDWYAMMRANLLARQAANGSWPDRDPRGGSIGPVYQTAIAVIILAIPSNYLPIFQR